MDGFLLPLSTLRGNAAARNAAPGQLILPRPVARQGVAHRNALACLLLLAAWGPTLLAQTVGSTEINWTTVAAQAYPNAEAQGTVVNG